MSIVDIGSIVSAAAAIVCALWKLTILFHKVLSKLEDFEEANKRNELHIMKLALFNDGLPLVDRIQCGKRYLELGGNGTGKVQYELLLEQMEELLESEADRKNNR